MSSKLPKTADARPPLAEHEAALATRRGCSVRRWVSVKQVSDAIDAAEDRLGPLLVEEVTSSSIVLQAVDQYEDRRVYRALPLSATRHGDGEHGITEAMNTLLRRENLDGARVVGVAFGAICGAVSALNTVIANSTASEGLFTAGLATGCGSAILLANYLVNGFFGRDEVREAMETLETMDTSGMVTVYDPDFKTSTNLGAARAYAMSAEGEDRLRGLNHYYESVAAVVRGEDPPTLGESVAAGASTATRPAPSGRVVTARSERWAQAWTRWEVVDEAWTDLMCDPHAALLHSQLLDVTLPRTAAFITAYADAKDALAVHGLADAPDLHVTATSGSARATPAAPANAVDVDRLTSLLAAAVTAWDEAYAHAKHVGYRWLPEDEQVWARRADKALTLALDKAADDGERANAAREAKRLLGDILTVRIPTEAHRQIEHIARAALTSADAATA